MTSTLTALQAALPAALQARLDEAHAAEQRGDRAVARDAYEALIRGLRDASQAPLVVMAMRAIARLYNDDVNADAAFDCLQAALAVAEATGDDAGAAHVINGIAVTHLRRGQLDLAEALCHDALPLAVAAGEARLSAMIHQNLGVVANIRGDYEAAERHYCVCLEGYTRLGLHRYTAHSLNNLGLLYAARQEWDAAERAYVEAARYADLAADASARVMIEVNRAGAWVGRRDLDRAQAACDAALALAREVGDERAIPEIDKCFGVIARERGEMESAEDAFARARVGADSRSDLLLAAEVAREHAELSWQQQAAPATLQHLNRAHRLFTQLRAQRALADVDRRMGRLEDSFLDIVRGWSHSIESADLYTRGHCDRVAEYASALASASGFDGQTLFWFQLGALLHDVGKIVIPPEVLNKPGKLTPEERAIIEEHPVAGVQMLADIDFPWDVIPMVRHHHERWDGTGYPDRLAGEAIPLAARVLCVADVYDALTSDRPYRAAFTNEKAIEVMRSMAGAFDPVLFDRFVEVLGSHAQWPIERASLPPTIAPRPRRITPAMVSTPRLRSA